MNKSILIVDDDQDFSDLLKGIFQQAGYTVHTAFSAEQGFDMLEKASISLIVSDHRLPGGITGTEFLTQLRKRGVNLPVIVVSGFLNDEAIRELIRDGVEGIFIKPLNIFSLLKKANDVLEARNKEAGKGTGQDDESHGGKTGRIGGISGKSRAGQDFLNKARKAAGFRRNLLLIGPKGTMFEDIAVDIARMAPARQRCEVVSPGSVYAERLDSLLAGELAASPVTLIVLDTEKLSPEEVQAIVDFGDKKGGSASPLRMIFCLGRPVEDLYEEEVIDDEFYLFLGANELKIPPLSKMPEDMLEITRRELLEQSRDAVFDMRIRSLLLSHPWEENFVELKSVIVRAISLAQPLAPTFRHFEAALHPRQSDTSALGDLRSTFERFLLQEKQRYRIAMEMVTVTRS